MSLIQLAPDALLRPAADRSGHWWVDSSERGVRKRVPSPQLLQWLSQLAKPMALAQLLAQWAPQDQPAVSDWLNQLIALGLVEISHRTTEPVPEIPSSQLLRALSRQVYDLCADIQGMGEFAESKLTEVSGRGVRVRVKSLVQQIHQLREQLAGFRKAYLEDQMEKLELGGSTSGFKLHLGCGPVHLDGFLNIDIAPAPLAMNVLWGLPFGDEQVRVVYLSHLLEHLFYPRDVMYLLAEAHRVLLPGGMIRIVVPDIALCLDAYQRRDQAFFDARRESFEWWPEDATALENFLTYAGVGADPSFLFGAHKYGYDFDTLAKALRNSGFRDVRKSSFNQSSDPELRIEEQSEAARWQANGQYLSLFVEASK